MNNVPFTIEEENLICIYHKHDRRRTIAAISDALPDMDADMRPLAEQTIHKLHNMTDAAFEEAQFTMTLSDAEYPLRTHTRGCISPTACGAYRFRGSLS